MSFSHSFCELDVDLMQILRSLTSAIMMFAETLEHSAQNITEARKHVHLSR